MNLSLRSTVLLSNFVRRRINSTEGNIEKAELLLTLFSNPKLGKLVETNIGPKDAQELGKLLKLEKKQLIAYQDLLNELSEVIPEFPHAYEVCIEAEKLKDSMLEAKEYSKEQKAIVDQMRAYDLVNHEYISIVDQEKPWIDFDGYYKGYEEKNAGK